MLIRLTRATLVPHSLQTTTSSRSAVLQSLLQTRVSVARTSTSSPGDIALVSNPYCYRAPGYRAEVRNRSVRVRNLPPGTQEGLLQQVLEKHAQVKRVEVFQDIGEAEVELENAAVWFPLLSHTSTCLLNLLRWT